MTFEETCWATGSGTKQQTAQLLGSLMKMMMMMMTTTTTTTTC
jgi:hypothetical protein